MNLVKSTVLILLVAMSSMCAGVHVAPHIAPRITPVRVAPVSRPAPVTKPSVVNPTPVKSTASTLKPVPNRYVPYHVNDYRASFSSFSSPMPWMMMFMLHNNSTSHSAPAVNTTDSKYGPTVENAKKLEQQRNDSKLDKNCDLLRNPIFWAVMVIIVLLIGVGLIQTIRF